MDCWNYILATFGAYFFLSRSAQLSTGTSSQDRHGTESSSCLEDLMQQLLKDLTDTTETSAGV